MLKNYFLTAWRNLTRNRAFSLINILGLALGLACSLLILLWVQDELRMDAFHAHGPQLYAVYERAFSDGKVDAGLRTPGLLARELKRKIPGIRYATTYDHKEGEETVFSLDDKRVSLPGSAADSSFFQMLSFPLLEGTPATALSSPNSIAISKSMAVNFFGSARAAYGRSLRMNNRRLMHITAVFDDLPTTSSLQFAFVYNYNNLLQDIDFLSDWIFRRPSTIIELQPGVDPARVETQIKDFVTPYLHTDNTGNRLELGLQRFDETYLHNIFRNGYPEGGRIEYVRLFMVIAVFILLIACINFMNLATARAVKRAKEVGIRKAIGALRIALIGQFVGEALLMTAFAIMVALALVILILPAFRVLTGKYIVLPLALPEFWLGILGLLLLTGLVAGSYPALFLSSLRPVQVLKGTPVFRTRPSVSKQLGRSSLKFGSGAPSHRRSGFATLLLGRNLRDPSVIRQGLVLFQFVLSIVLIIATIVITNQVHYMQTKHLGFDRDNLVYIPFQGDLWYRYQVFNQQLLGQPGIAGVTESMQAPSHIEHVGYDIGWDGKPADEHVVAIHNGINYGYLNMMKVPIIQGRDFSRDHPTDSGALIINETFRAMTGFKDPIGKRITFFGGRHPIIGVVKDFHLRSLRDPIEPLILFLADTSNYIYGGGVLVKTVPHKEHEAVASMEKVFRSLEPAFPFRYYFADEDYQRLYASEQTVSRLADGFSALAIIISCLGLLGLSIFTAEQRRKEIGVRKVIGASTGSIVSLLSSEIVRLIVLAALVATPLAWIAMHSWLQGFAYRVDIGWWVFLASGGVALLIALMTISWQAMKAARANPVRALRSE
jgi:putative ABC transport system permease protein